MMVDGDAQSQCLFIVWLIIIGDGDWCQLPGGGRARGVDSSRVRLRRAD